MKNWAAIILYQSRLCKLSFRACIKLHEFYSLGMSDLVNGVGGAINISGGGSSPKGRGGFTGIDSDMYKFKVPQLYNLKDVNFFGHGCSLLR